MISVPSLEGSLTVEYKRFLLMLDLLALIRMELKE
jgi:hypothetical protein